MKKIKILMLSTALMLACACGNKENPEVVAEDVQAEEIMLQTQADYVHYDSFEDFYEDYENGKISAQEKYAIPGYIHFSFVKKDIKESFDYRLLCSLTNEDETKSIALEIKESELSGMLLFEDGEHDKLTAKELASFNALCNVKNGDNIVVVGCFNNELSKFCIQAAESDIEREQISCNEKVYLAEDILNEQSQYPFNFRYNGNFLPYAYNDNDIVSMEGYFAGFVDYGEESDYSESFMYICSENPTDETDIISDYLIVSTPTTIKNAEEKEISTSDLCYGDKLFIRNIYKTGGNNVINCSSIVVEEPSSICDDISTAYVTISVTDGEYPYNLTFKVLINNTFREGYDSIGINYMSDQTKEWLGWDVSAMLHESNYTQQELANIKGLIDAYLSHPSIRTTVVKKEYTGK